MDNTKDDFEARKIEIEDYFKFLHIIDDERTFLKYSKSNVMVEERVPTKLQITLIANTFLILYNVIESTVRNSIVEIYEKIKEDEVSYNDLSAKLKIIWLKQKTKNIKDGNTRESTIQKNIENIIVHVVENEIISLTKDDIDISGNIDAEKIRELAKEIGFDKSTHGQNLVIIKNKRNSLAHGNNTFYDIGRDYSVSDVSTFKEETFEYLSDVIINIENFLNNEKYKID